MKRIAVLLILAVVLAGCIGTTPTPESPPPTPTIESPLPTPALAATVQSPLPTPISPLPTPQGYRGDPPIIYQIQEETDMELGNIGPVEVLFMAMGLAQLVWYFTTKPAVKGPDGSIVVPAIPAITGRARVAVALAIVLPLLGLREVLYAGLLSPGAVSVVESVARVIGDSLGLLGNVNLLKEITGA